MTTTTPGRWPIWTDGGATSTSFRAEPATWVYRLADGTYLTIGPDGAGGIREMPSPDRPTTPDGHPIPLQWNRLVAKLPPGPTTDAFMAEWANSFHPLTMPTWNWPGLMAQGGQLPREKV